MKLLDALRVGFEVLAAKEAAEKLGIPVDYNWSWRLGRKRLRLMGVAMVEDAS